MVQGIDLKAFAREAAEAAPAKRRALYRRYDAWNLQAVTSARRWSGSGLLLIGLVGLWVFAGRQSVPTVLGDVVAGLGFFAGLFLIWMGWRKERQWRRENPFILTDLDVF